MKSALIIIDMQNDFLPGGSLAVKDGDQIIPKINALSKDYSLVVATQDWHPQNHSSFASNNVGNTVFETIMINGLPQTLWPDHCVQASLGAEISPEIEQQNIDTIFRKGTHKEIDSYSAFFDNAHQSNTGLYGYLKDKEITDIFICGLAADFCVYYTALNGLELGFETTIILDATKAIDNDNFEKLKIDFQNKGGRFI
jgi:nicotinamidase/pyrazinamidase